MNFVLSLLRDFGLDDFYLELSTRDDSGAKGKFIGSEEQWAEGDPDLADVAAESGLDLVPDPGGAAFYGPDLRPGPRRHWPHLADVDDQYDFNQPERFGLEYQAADGSRRLTPVIGAELPRAQRVLV